MRAVPGVQWHQRGPGVLHHPQPQELQGALGAPEVLGVPWDPEGNCLLVFCDGTKLEKGGKQNIT